MVPDPQPAEGPPAGSNAEHAEQQQDADAPGKFCRAAWFKGTINTEACFYCGKDDWTPGFGPRTVLRCNCCYVRCMHVECRAKAAGEELTEAVMEPDAVLICDAVRAALALPCLVDCCGERRRLCWGRAGACMPWSPGTAVTCCCTRFKLLPVPAHGTRRSVRR